MTDGQWLFAVFAALYLLECVRWLPLRAVVLSGSGGKGGWTASGPLPQAQSRGAGAFLLPVLPPMQCHLVAMAWPVSPREEGLEVRDGAGAEVRVPWEALAVKIEGATLHLEAATRARLPCEAAAREWRDRARAWTAMSQADRERDFQKAAKAALDVERVTELARTLSESTKWLRILAAVILVWCFGVITLVYRWHGESPLALATAGVLLALQLAQAVLFLRIARRARFPVAHRWWKALAIALLPQMSTRAADFVCKAVTLLPHPLAARELLGDERWTREARRFWREARHPAGARSDAPPSIEAAALQRFFERQKIALADLEPPPERSGDARSYCPRCLTVFQIEPGACADCGGVELRRFEGTAARASPPSETPP